MTWKIEENRLYAEDVDGALLAETTFPPAGEGVVDIDHTYVDESLRGQGIAGQMMETVGGHSPPARAQGPGQLSLCRCLDGAASRNMPTGWPSRRRCGAIPIEAADRFTKTGPAWCSHAGPLGLSEPGKAHLTPIITDKRNESGGNRSILPIFGACGRPIAAGGGDPFRTLSPSELYRQPPPFHKVGILDENHSDSSLFSLRPHRTAAAAAMTAKGQPLPRSGPSHVIQR